MAPFEPEQGETELGDSDDEDKLGILHACARTISSSAGMVAHDLGLWQRDLPAEMVAHDLGSGDEIDEDANPSHSVVSFATDTMTQPRDDELLLSTVRTNDHFSWLQPLAAEVRAMLRM